MRSALVMAVACSMAFLGCLGPHTQAPNPENHTPVAASLGPTMGAPTIEQSGGIEPLARLRCTDGSLLPLVAGAPNQTQGCNHEMTISNVGNEATIAVDPTNPLHVIGGAKDYTDPDAGDCVWDGVYTTLDGGGTWKNQQLPGSPWRKLKEPTTAAVNGLTNFWCTTDPIVEFSPDGKIAYYAALAYQCDPVTAGPTGGSVLAQAGLHGWPQTCAQMFVLRSRDGGLTWPEITGLAPAGSNPVAFHDHPWLHVDRLTGRVYVGWAVFHAGGFPTNWLYWSDDEGATFNGPVITSTADKSGQRVPNLGGQGVRISAGPNSMVYVSWDLEVTEMVVSHDGGQTFGTPLKVPTQSNFKPLYGTWPDEAPRIIDSSASAVDTSDGPYRGRLYFAARTDAFGHADIGFTSSDDHGATWSDLRRLNDDAAEDSASFFAAVSVNPNGVVDVVWYDQRVDPEHHNFDLYYTYSLDGGVTWAPNLRITEVSSAPEPSKNQNGQVFIGDYIDIDSTTAYAHPAWADTRNGVSDVYTAWIERPSYPVAAAP